MARWRCNAPNPGSYLQGRGVVFPGQEFTTPDDPDDPFFERARQMWVPLDGGADKLVSQAKKDVEEMNKENARAAAERKKLEEESASGFRKAEFKTREDQGPGIAQSERFVGKFTADEEHQKRNDAWTKQVRKEQKKDESPETLAVQSAIREHQALAGGAAAQPVADPGDLTAGPDKPKSDKGSKK